MYKVFGTYNTFAILSPSLRNVPFTGIEWSYQLKDLGYNEAGEMGKHNFDEEEKLHDDKDTEGSELEMSELSRRHGSGDNLDIDS